MKCLLRNSFQITRMGSFCIKYHYEDNFIFKKKSGRESGPLLRGHTLSAPGSAGEEAGSHFSPASVRLMCRCGRSLAPRAQPRADSPAETGASPRLSNAAGALLRLDTHVPQAAASSRSAATWRLKPCRTLFGPVKTPGASLSLKLPSAHTFGSCVQGAGPESRSSPCAHVVSAGTAAERTLAGASSPKRKFLPASSRHIMGHRRCHRGPLP